jgi:O-antigen/teichoic acid export membrane protein
MANTVSLAGSNLWRIATSFLLQLLIARQLGLEMLGAYTIVMAYLNVCQVVSELGLPGLLVRDLAQRPEHRLAYFRIALGLQMAASLVIWGLLALLAWLLPLAPTTQVALWIIGASLPFAAFTSVTQTLFQAGERMELVLGVEGVINTIILLASIAALWLGAGLLTLVGLLIVTQALSALVGWLLVLRTGLLAAPQETVPLDLPLLARRATPFFGFSIADVLLQRVDILLLSVVAGETVAGIYSAAYQLVRVLLKLVQSFWRALYPTLSRLQREAQPHYVRLATLGLHTSLLLLLPCAVLLSFLAQPVLQLVFGGDSLPATPVLQILVWSAPLLLVETFAATVLMVEQDPVRSLLVSSIHFVGIVLLLPELTTTWGAVGTAWAGVLSGLLSAGVGLWLLRQVALPLKAKRIVLLFLLMVLLTLAGIGLGWSSLVAIPLILFVYGLAVWQADLLGAEERRAVRNVLVNPNP